jgi:iron complex outermembrane recepter protein
MCKRIGQNIISIFIAVLALGPSNGYGQAGTTKTNAYEDLSLKDLLNVKIVSVSKKSELLFDAPLSASVLTKEEIQQAGCTSIMEALRLVPGMIVREQTNGNYDIQVRGMGNYPTNASFDAVSTTMLAMIDGRPVYNYLKGGTFWETLPVDLNDVEKIEVVRGPAAALYGPNAVSGVINIITRHPQKVGFYGVANSSLGSYHSFIDNASVGYRSKNWSLITSGNYQGRERAQTSYYEMYRDRWLEQPAYLIDYLGDTSKNVSQMYPKPRMAMDKYAGNVFLEYNPAEKIKFNISAGAQHSMVQKVSTENGMTPLTTNSSDTRYVDLRANINALSAQVSYNKGTQITDFNPGNKYDFNTLDANLEYNYTKGAFSIKPGIRYQSAVYDDTKYVPAGNEIGVFNARVEIVTQTASLRGEYKLLDDKLRFVAGWAANKFNYPNATYGSYEFAATYKVNKNQLFRAVYSRAPRSSTIYDTYVDQTYAYYPSGNQQFTRYALEGNKDLTLLTSDMSEMGYRGAITAGLHVDVELFDIRSQNYSAVTGNGAYTQLSGADTIIVIPTSPTNLPLKLEQQGITVSFTYNSRKLQIKPFVTIQRSMTTNDSRYRYTSDAPVSQLNPDPAQNNIYSDMGMKSAVKGTPSVFGGGSVNYSLSSKMNINMSAYYYSSQTYSHVSNVIFNDGIRGIDHINAKLIINANITYEPAKGLHLFCSGKNIGNDNSREFFRSDAVPAMLLAGINYEF